MARFELSAVRARWPFWALTVFLILAFLTGGGSRDDIQSLVILRPAAVIFCGVALLGLRWEQVRAYRFLFAMTVATFGLVILHLVPLPPAIWGALPGRHIVVEIDKAAQLGAIWRPISLVPTATWNAFYSLFVPLAVLLLGVQLTREQRFQILPITLGLGLLSGILGLLQSIGAPDGPLYFYGVTSDGGAVGLFANRNHQAVFLASMFPMLATYATTSSGAIDHTKRRVWIAVASGLVLVPLILITGSRAGLVAGLLALGLAGLIYSSSNPHHRKTGRNIAFNSTLAFVVIVVFSIGALTALMSRAESLRRLFAPDQIDDLRFRVWGPIFNMAWKYFPVGSGIGSFVEVYQVDEPSQLLMTRYLNHAHNDFLEIYLTAGLPGMVFLAVATGAFVHAGVSLFASSCDGGRGLIFARLGGAILVLLSLASLGDYPLRTPSMMCVFALAALWLTGEAKQRSKSAGGD